mmetsp:Transcript_61916/g.164541  ORF Transcript_61916/g.164541 Transcript_61916/m.164541 type:complete len:219 (+) Transcript_61916:218-874(+)
MPLGRVEPSINGSLAIDVEHEAVILYLADGARVKVRSFRMPNERWHFGSRPIDAGIFRAEALVHDVLVVLQIWELKMIRQTVLCLVKLPDKARLDFCAKIFRGQCKFLRRLVDYLAMESFHFDQAGKREKLCRKNSLCSLAWKFTTVALGPGQLAAWLHLAVYELPNLPEQPVISAPDLVGEHRHHSFHLPCSIQEHRGLALKDLGPQLEQVGGLETK